MAYYGELQAMKGHAAALQIIRAILTIALSLAFIFGSPGITELTHTAYAAPAPDLIIETITWSPQNPSIGDSVTFSVTIKNQGDGEAGSSRVAYYADGIHLGSASVNSLAPGASTTKTFTWTAEAGSHTIKAIADSDNNVAESNENNNEKTFAFSPAVADLIIQNISWSPQNPSKGDTLTFSITIKNQGSGSAAASRVDFYIDGSSRGYQQVQRMDAGNSATITYTWIAKAGSHDTRAVADAENYVTESDEANNEKSVTFSTLAPDLIIQDITWTPESPSENDNVTFTISVKNQGSGKADNSRIAFHIGDIFQTSASVSAIDAGSTTSNTTFIWKAKSGSHVIRAVADTDMWVAESDETNNEKTITFSPLAPDLVILDITWTPEAPSIGDKVSFTVTIKNQGSGRAAASRAAFFVEGFYSDYQDVSAINAGATVTKVFSWTTEPGSFDIIAIADLGGIVLENNEENNKKVITFAPLAPDLTVQDITWAPEDASIGDTVTFTVTVKNQGGGRADDSRITYYINDEFLTSVFVDSLDADATANQTFTWTAEVGSHAIKTAADSSNIIAENDETNNEKTVFFSPIAPDLVIETITWSPENPSAGDSMTFTVILRNQGNDRADYSRLAYYIDGLSRGYHDIEDIEAGSALTSTFTWTAETGSHAIKVVADANNMIVESDESNNRKTLNLPPPDLILQNIAWFPENPATGDAVTFTATIKNQGSGKADESLIAFYINDSPINHQELPEINPGATVTKTFTWTAEVGSYIIRAVADDANNITESSETNNEKKITFATAAPDLTVQDITWALENPSNVEDITFTIIIKNRGNKQAGYFHIAYYTDDVHLATDHMEPMDAGATMTRTFTWAAPKGPHSIRTVVDSDDNVTESDETNNEQNLAFTTAAPDLTVQDITWTPKNPIVGDLLTFTVTVENRGNERADNSHIAFYVDDVFIGYKNLPRINAGAKALETFTWLAEASSCVIKVAADSSETVTESDETNNSEQQTLSLSAAAAGTAGSSPAKATPIDLSEKGLLEEWWWAFLAAGILITIVTGIAIVKS
ncbi:CARDB domain-containing protein [Chloroflexota bacterium]